MTLALSVARWGLFVGALVMVWRPSVALGQDPFAGWSRPVVTEVEFYAALSGQRASRLNLSRRILLSAGDSITIEARPLDQRGRRFPRDRFRLDVALQPACEERLSVSQTSSGDLRFTAGRERGRCPAVVWVPGNLNLEFDLEFEIAGLGSTNYTRAQAEFVVERLYRAILQRDVDAPARGAAITEVQRGRIENQVRSMVGSTEFQELRQRSDPGELLDAFYRGLLGRPPDAGARRYLEDIIAGRYVPALMNLIQSEEFETQLLGER